MTHMRPIARGRWPLCAALAVGLTAGVAGCGDDPFAFDWNDTPDTVLLYSLARPELNLESGFAFLQGRRVRVEAPGATGNWDVAVDTRGGEIVWMPPGALGVSAAARVSALDGIAFDDVREVPSDTALFVADQPVPVRMGTVYVMKTNRSTGSFGTRCIYHAKVEAVDIDVAGGTLVFRHVTNPICNSRDLVPPR